jgi:hypothetical protein
MKIRITDHGRERFKARTRLPLRSIRATVRRAFETGANMADVDLPVRHHLLAQNERLRRLRSDANNITLRHLQGCIYVFADTKKGATLLTVLPLSPDDAKAVAKYLSEEG